MIAFKTLFEWMFASNVGKLCNDACDSPILCADIIDHNIYASDIHRTFSGRLWEYYNDCIYFVKPNLSPDRLDLNYFVVCLT